MPIYKRKDSKGYYYQWGNRGAHYYFDPMSKRSSMIAYHKALEQAKAAYANE